MKNNQITQEFNTALFKAQEYHDLHEILYLEYIARSLACLLHTQKSNNAPILDMGCGNGLLTRLLQILCTTDYMYGIDSNKEILDAAQKMYPSIHFLHNSGQTLPFENNTFEILYAHEVLHHIPQQLHKQYAWEMYRILKPGGTALIVEFNPHNPWTRYVFNHNPEEQGLTMLTPYYIKKLLRPYGSVTIHYFGFFQRWFTQLRFLEKFFCKIPLGSLYAAILHKP